MVWFPASLLIDQQVETATIVTGFVVMGVWTAFFYPVMNGLAGQRVAPESCAWGVRLDGSFD